MFLPDHCPGQVVYWTHEFVPIPIRLMNGGHIILPVTLNGVETHAMLDTGAGSTFVSKQLARSKLDIDPVASGDQPDGYAIGGTGAKLPFYRHHIRQPGCWRHSVSSYPAADRPGHIELDHQ